MLRIGLTGGIASGKTTVARRFAALGVPVLDADAIYHGLIAPTATGPSPLAQCVSEAFAGVLRADGSLDRAQLGRQVFGDAEARSRLEALTHPAVAAAAEAGFAALAKAGHAWALYDVPLLYERAMASRFAGVVVVWVPRAVQRKRLAERDGLVGEAAEARLRAQLPLDDKRSQAQWTIDNSGDPQHTATQVDEVRRAIDALAKRARAPRH